MNSQHKAFGYIVDFQKSITDLRSFFSQQMKKTLQLEDEGKRHVLSYLSNYLSQIDAKEMLSKAGHGHFPTPKSHLSRNAAAQILPAEIHLDALPLAPDPKAFQVKLHWFERFIVPMIGNWRQIRAEKKYQEAFLRYQIAFEKTLAENKQKQERYHLRLQEIQKQISSEKMEN